MRRKLLLGLMSMISGILLWIYRTPLVLALIGILLIIYAVLFNIWRKQDNKIIICVIIFILIGTFRTSIAEIEYKESLSYGQKSYNVECKIYKIDKQEEEKYKVYCSDLVFDGEENSGKFLINYYKSIPEFQNLIGNKIRLSCEILSPEESGNPRTFDYRKFLRSQEIYYTTSTSYFQVLNVPKPFFDKIKCAIISKREAFLVCLNCNDEIKGFIRGVIFGDKSQLDDEIYEDFRNNGTAHILAVSGLHVGILYGIYKGILKKKKSKIISLLFFLLLIGYGTLTLWSISVTRAILLVAIITLGDFLERRYDLLTALAFVAMIVLLKNPYMIESAAFQMSFLAVTSIAFLSPVMERFTPKGVASMLAVQIGMMPYTAYVFNYLPLGAIVCNVPIIFFTSILVPIGLGTFMVYFLTSFAIGQRILNSMAELLVTVNEFLAQNGLFAKDVPSPKLWVITLFYLIIFGMCSEIFFINIKRKEKTAIIKMAALTLSTVLVVGVVGYSEFDNAFMVFIDVGQGDSIHLKCSDNQDLLFDGGGNVNYNVGKKILKPYLLKNGVRNVDLAAATHLHTDHYLGIEELDKCYNIKSVITKSTLGTRITVDKQCFIDIIWPVKLDKNIEDENLNSLIFKISYKGITTLVTGDITAEGENALIEHYKGTDVLKCDILKVAHHGSKYSSSDEFLQVVNPKIAVISVGKNNYGHPSNDVIEKLNQKGIIVFRTDQDGAVGIIERKGKIHICTKKQRRKEVLKSFQKT